MRTFAQKPKPTQQTKSESFTTLGRPHLGHSREVRSVLQLQRTIGNQAVQRLIQTNHGDIETSSTSAAGTHFSHDFSRIPIYPTAQAIPTKLTPQVYD